MSNGVFFKRNLGVTNNLIPGRKQHGWALTEIVLAAVIGGLTAATLLTYGVDHLRRSTVVAATGALTSYGLLLEQHYSGQRSYGDSGCGVAPPAVDGFVISCAAVANGQGFRATATGTGRLVSGLVYSLEHTGRMSTTCNACSWSFKEPIEGWILSEASATKRTAQPAALRLDR